MQICRSWATSAICPLYFSQFVAVGRSIPLAVADRSSRALGRVRYADESNALGLKGGLLNATMLSESPRDVRWLAHRSDL